MYNHVNDTLFFASEMLGPRSWILDLEFRVYLLLLIQFDSMQVFSRVSCQFESRVISGAEGILHLRSISDTISAGVLLRRRHVEYTLARTLHLYHPRYAVPAMKTTRASISFILLLYARSRTTHLCQRQRLWLRTHPRRRTLGAAKKGLFFCSPSLVRRRPCLHMAG